MNKALTYVISGVNIANFGAHSCSGSTDGRRGLLSTDSTISLLMSVDEAQVSMSDRHHVIVRLRSRTCSFSLSSFLSLHLVQHDDDVFSSVTAEVTTAISVGTLDSVLVSLATEMGVSSMAGVNAASASIDTTAPTVMPTPTPTLDPTPSPTPQPTVPPSSLPTPMTPAPTPGPSHFPTTPPTPSPSRSPTPLPSLMPTPAPTQVPTLLPTPIPSAGEFFWVARVATTLYNTSGGETLVIDLNYSNPLRASLIDQAVRPQLNISGMINGSCTRLRWLTGSRVTCSTPAGVGEALTLAVSLANQRPLMSFLPTDAETFSYEPPKVHSIDPNAGFRSGGGDVVSVYGRGFGPLNVGITHRVLIDGEPCQVDVVHISDRHVRCDSTPPGQGSLRGVTVVVANRSSAMQALFSYERPSIDDLVPSANLDAMGGKLVIIGRFLGTATEVEAGNATVSVGGKPCGNLLVRASDAVLQCSYPPGEGTNLPVIVTVVDRKAQKSQWSSPPAFIGYAEELTQLVVMADVVMREPVFLDALTLERTITTGLQRLDSDMSAHVVGTGTRNRRSLDGALDQYRVVATPLEMNQQMTQTQATIISDALNRSLHAWVHNATGVQSQIKINNTRSVYCPPGTERVGSAGNFVCEKCARDFSQPYPSVDGEECLPCDHEGGQDCQLPGTELPVPKTGYWRDINAATEARLRWDFVEFKVHRCLWTSHRVCEGGLSSECIEGHDPYSPLCAICLPGWHMYGGRCGPCKSREFVRNGFVSCGILAVVIMVAGSALFVLRGTVVVKGSSLVLKPDDESPRTAAAKNELNVTSRLAYGQVHDGPASGLSSAPQRQTTSSRFSLLQSFQLPGLSTKLKIFISFLQVMATLQSVYSIPWPSSFLR